ncbi:DUF6113 family protein [Streptomyces sp. WMMC905]|uniref:DUF6113 family protein n=1 Tax=Streptomyces sp. WMMC905 TaxID=3404123 RepID=UPI003B931465
MTGVDSPRPLRPPARPSLGRALAYLLLLVAGAVVGTAGALTQSARPPGGLLLALAAEVGVCVGAAVLVGTRGAAVVTAAGWSLAVVLLTTSRPEGDFLFAAQAGSYLFLLGGIALAVLCATLAPVRFGAAGGPLPGGPTEEGA